MASSLEILNAVNNQFQLNVPMAVLTLTTVAASNTNMADSTFFPMSLDTSVMDPYSGHSASVNPSRYTSQVAGWYWVRGAASFTVGNNTGNRGVQLYVNGTAVTYALTILQANATANFGCYEVNAPVFLAAGSYVETWVFQSSGTTASLHAAGCNMSLRWIHA